MLCSMIRGMLDRDARRRRLGPGSGQVLGNPEPLLEILVLLALGDVRGDRGADDFRHGLVVDCRHGLEFVGLVGGQPVVMTLVVYDGRTLLIDPNRPDRHEPAHLP